MTRPIVAVNDLNVCLMYVCLSQTRFFRRNITPFLDNWLLDLPGVGSGPGADLLGDINAFFLGFKLGHQFGDVLAGTLGLQRTLFLGSILDNGLGFVITLFSSLSESTASRSAKFPGFLSTSGDGRVLLDILLGNGAHLLGPLAALGVGGVATGLILTLLLIDSFTFNNIIFNIMFFLLGPALALVLGTADLGSLDIAILHKRSTADLDSFVESDLLVFNETVFPEVFGERIGGLMRDGFLCVVVALGNELGIFDHLEDASEEEGIDSQTLADNLGYKERYVREWLAAVVTGEIVDVAKEEGKYYLSKEKAKYLSRRHGDTPALHAWLLPMNVGAYNDVLAAFKKDGPLGVPYSRYPNYHNYRQAVGRHTFSAYVENKLLHICPEIWEAASSESGISVCEIGCSEGILTEILAQKFPDSRFWASDIGEEEILKCNEMKAAKNLKNVMFEVQDATKLPPDWTEKFDLIICYLVIHDIGRPDLAVEELTRVLRKDGTAVFLDIGLDSNMENNIGNPAASCIYSNSLLCCLPTSLSFGPDAWGLGAGWGKQRAEELFLQHGFKSIDAEKYGDNDIVYVLTKSERPEGPMRKESIQSESPIRKNSEESEGPIRKEYEQSEGRLRNFGTAGKCKCPNK